MDLTYGAEYETYRSELREFLGDWPPTGEMATPAGAGRCNRCKKCNGQKHMCMVMQLLWAHATPAMPTAML